MLLSTLNEALVRFPIYVGIATVTKNASVVQRERLVRVRRVCDRHSVEIVRHCDDGRIVFTQIERGDASLWVETFPDPFTGKSCSNTRAPVYQVIRLIPSHID